MYCKVVMAKVIISLSNHFGRGANEMGRTLTGYACLLPRRIFQEWETNAQYMLDFAETVNVLTEALDSRFSGDLLNISFLEQ